MDEIKKLQNRINQLESEMEGLDDSGIDQYADEIYRLEQQIDELKKKNKLKIKKEDIEKYATEKEKKLLEVKTMDDDDPEEYFEDFNLTTITKIQVNGVYDKMRITDLSPDGDETMELYFGDRKGGREFLKKLMKIKTI